MCLYAKATALVSTVNTELTYGFVEEIKGREQRRVAGYFNTRKVELP